MAIENYAPRTFLPNEARVGLFRGLTFIYLTAAQVLNVFCAWKFVSYDFYSWKRRSLLCLLAVETFSIGR